MSGTSATHEYLRQAHVPYSVLPHRPSFSAQTDAAAAHVPGRRWAKVVVCYIDGCPVEAVVPATLDVDLQRLLELAGGSAIRLAHEDELGRLFPSCEAGAMPPLGPMYGQAVFVDIALAAERDIVFDGGTHTEAIAMRWADFARTVRPVVGRFAARPLEGITALPL